MKPATLTIDGQAWPVTLHEATFQSGKSGFRILGKVAIGEVGHQVTGYVSPITPKGEKPLKGRKSAKSAKAAKAAVAV